MPLYEFACKTCGVQSEANYPISASVQYPNCQGCGEQMVRLYNFGSVSFKGSGFYTTDKK